MGGSRGGGFAPVEVVLELGSLLLLARDEGGFHDSLIQIERAQAGTGRGVVIDPLGKDVASTGKDLGHGGHGRGLGIDRNAVAYKGGGLLLGIGQGILGPEELGKRFKTEFLGDRGASPLPRLGGEVDVLERGQCRGGIHLCAEFLGEQFAFLERGDDRFAPLVEGFKLLNAVADRRDLHLVEFAGALLAVPSDEGNGRTFLEKNGRGSDLTGLKTEFLGNLNDVFFEHGERLFRLKTVRLLGKEGRQVREGIKGMEDTEMLKNRGE